jgi:hypothetical protein
VGYDISPLKRAKLKFLLKELGALFEIFHQKVGLLLHFKWVLQGIKIKNIGETFVFE